MSPVLHLAQNMVRTPRTCHTRHNMVCQYKKISQLLGFLAGNNSSAMPSLFQYTCVGIEATPTACWSSTFSNSSLNQDHLPSIMKRTRTSAPSHGQDWLQDLQVRGQPNNFTKWLDKSLLIDCVKSSVTRPGRDVSDAPESVSSEVITSPHHWRGLSDRIYYWSRNHPLGLLNIS